MAVKAKSDQANGVKFRKLLKESGYSQERIASLMSIKSGQPLSARSIRAWISDPEVKTWRACPDWAVELLQFVLEEN